MIIVLKRPVIKILIDQCEPLCKKGNQLFITILVIKWLITPLCLTSRKLFFTELKTRDRDNENFKFGEIIC